MDGYVLAWHWLAHGAVGGLIVLGLGSLAAWLCRQPVRRARVVVLTLLGGFAVPWLGALPLAPRWSAGIVLPAPRALTLSGANSRRRGCSGLVLCQRAPRWSDHTRRRPLRVARKRESRRARGFGRRRAS